MTNETMRIQQGAVYWVQHQPDDVVSRIAHPHVVIQDNARNQDPAVRTVVVCAITTNAKKISMPGNVLLEPGEANLPQRSIVEVAKQTTIDKIQLGDYIGTVSEQRVAQIMAGIRFVRRSFFDDR